MCHAERIKVFIKALSPHRVRKKCGFAIDFYEKQYKKSGGYSVASLNISMCLF